MTLTDPEILLAVALSAVFTVGVITCAMWGYNKCCNGMEHLRRWHVDRMCTEAGRRAIARRTLP